MSETPFRSYFKADREPKSKKRYIIPKKKVNASNRLKSGINTMWGYTSQIDMFESMWAKALIEGKGKVKCPFTNEDITHYADGQMSFWLACFAHILPKSKYPSYKLNPDNVRIVYPEFHSIVDQGRFSDRFNHSTWKWDEWDSLCEEKKSEYKLFIAKHL